jgi:hypothetical protein
MTFLTSISAVSALEKRLAFFVMLSAAKASKCAKMLSKSCFLDKIQMLLLRSA